MPELSTIGPRVMHAGLLADAPGASIGTDEGTIAGEKTASAPREQGRVQIARIISAAAGACGPGPVDIALMTRQMQRDMGMGSDSGSGSAAGRAAEDSELDAAMARHG